MGCAGFSTSRTTLPSLELGHPEMLRLGDASEQDERVRLHLREALHDGDDAVADEVVAEVHDERSSPEEVAGAQHGVRQAARRVLRDVGDPRAES